jgi:hypothetical protein
VAMAIVNRRVIKGWRSLSIDQTLDRIAQKDGFIEVDRTKEKGLDSRGARSRIYADMDEKHRVERLRYKDKIKARDAEKYRQLKLDHADYSALYSKLYPGSLPASINSFLKSGASKLWKQGEFEEAVSTTFGLGDDMKKKQDAGFDEYRATAKKIYSRGRSKK